MKKLLASLVFIGLGSLFGCSRAEGLPLGISLPNDTSILKAMLSNGQCNDVVSIRGLAKLGDERWQVYYNTANSYASNAQLMKFHNGSWAVECGNGLTGQSISKVQ